MKEKERDERGRRKRVKAGSLHNRIPVEISLHWCKHCYVLVPINYLKYVRFEFFTAVTMTNGVFWNVTPFGSCKNRHFGGTLRLPHQGNKNR
jgi:hypothetical protein